MKNTKHKNKYYIYNQIKNYCIEFKGYIIVCLLAVILGAVLGIITIEKTSIEITIESITDSLLLDFLKGDCSWISFIFYKLLESIAIIFLLLFPIYSVYLIPITLIMLIYKTYYYFLNLTIFIKCISFFSIINTIFTILPVYIITILLYLILTTISLKLAFDLKNLQPLFCRINYKNNLIKIVLFLFLSRLFIITYQVVMLLLFSNKFIIT